MAVKRDITFPNPFDGTEITETYYFQLSKADILEMDLFHDLLGEENPIASLGKIVEDKDSRRLLDLWKSMLFAAVGKRKGNLFDKSPEVIQEFRQSGAYNQFLGELMESDDAGASFFVSIMPTDIQEKAKEEMSRSYTKEQLLDMSDEEFDLIAGTDLRKMTPEHMQIAMHRLSNSKKGEAA